MSGRLLLSLLLLARLLLASGGGQAAPHQLPGSSRALDAQMAATLQSLSSGNLDEAHVLARQMAARFPGSSLAQLLAAEMATAAAHEDVLLSSAIGPNQALMDLLLEARARLSAADTADRSVADGSGLDLLPDEIVQLGKDVSSLVVIDLEDSSLRHLAVSDGKPTLMRQHYIGSGEAGYGKQVEGDRKTPLGIYRINGQRSDASLPDLYGAGALTLDYPNALDRYLGRTGGGIWLHGVPRKQRNRAPRSSRGCVTMSNDHFTSLQKRLSVPQTGQSDTVVRPQPEPLVLLTHSTQWNDSWQRRPERLYFQELFARYQKAWRERDSDALLALYEQPELPLATVDRIELHDATHRAPLDNVDKRDISIFHNPSIQPAITDADTPDERPFVVMRALLGSENKYQLTLFWAPGENGDWQVITEQWDALNS